MDLQPDNIVMASVRTIHVKLIDFGSAHKVSKLGAVVGTNSVLEFTGKIKIIVKIYIDMRILSPLPPEILEIYTFFNAQTRCIMYESNFSRRLRLDSRRTCTTDTRVPYPPVHEYCVNHNSKSPFKERIPRDDNRRVLALQPQLKTVYR